MCKGLSRLQARHIRNCRMGSDIQEDLIGREHTRPSVVQFHLEGLRRHETAAADDQLGTARLVNLQVLRNLTFHHLTFALTNRRHVDSDRTGHCAIIRAVTRDLRDLRA
jgi:hypothetical protein